MTIMIVIGILIFVSALVLLIVRGLKWITILLSIFMGIAALGFITVGFYGKQNQKYETMTANQFEENIGENNDSDLNDNNYSDNNTSDNQTSRQSQNSGKSQGQTSRSRQSNSSNSGQSNSGNSTQPSSGNSEQSKSSLRDKYLAELDALTRKTDSMRNNSGETMMGMNTTASEIYELWDDELNKIYGVLKQELSASEMENLRQEEREWIKYRDSEAEAAASQYAGGTMAPLEQVETKSDLTRDRCYELVNSYMK